MVAERVERSEDERADWYEYMQNEEETEALDPAWEYVERQDAEMALHRHLQDQFYNGPAVNIRDNNYQPQHQLFNLQQEAVNQCWECLHSKEDHYKLCNVIMRQLQENSKKY